MAITVNTATTYQTIDGFGVDVALIDTVLSDALADQFFSPTAGIGITWCRLRASVVDGTVPSYGGLNAGMIGSAQKARDRGARFWALADGENTTPDAWKIGGVSSNDLDPAHYADYAAGFKKIADYMATQGLNVERVSICNEPDLGQTYTVLRSGTAVHDVVAAAPAGSPPLMMPETSARINLPSFGDPTLNDAATRAKLASVATHVYDGTTTSYSTAATYGVPVWQTEYNQNGAPADATMTSAFTVAQTMNACLLNNYTMFGFFLVAGLPPFSGYTYGLLGDGYSDTKRFWAFGNFSRFVRPGFRRVACSGAPVGVYASAYLSAGGDPVVITINANATDTAIALSGLGSMSQATPWITDATRNLKAQGAISVSGGTASYTLPAQSVTTFIRSPPWSHILRAVAWALDVQSTAAFSNVTSQAVFSAASVSPSTGASAVATGMQVPVSALSGSVGSSSLLPGIAEQAVSTSRSIGSSALGVGAGTTHALRAQAYAWDRASAPVLATVTVSASAQAVLSASGIGSAIGSSSPSIGAIVKGTGLSGSIASVAIAVTPAVNTFAATGIGASPSSVSVRAGASASAMATSGSPSLVAEAVGAAFSALGISLSLDVQLALASEPVRMVLSDRSTVMVLIDESTRIAIADRSTAMKLIDRSS